jgi:hypothetical protein
MYIVNTEVIIWLHSVNKKTEVGGQEMMQVRRWMNKNLWESDTGLYAANDKCQACTVI